MNQIEFKRFMKAMLTIDTWDKEVKECLARCLDPAFTFEYAARWTINFYEDLKDLSDEERLKIAKEILADRKR
jgi:hypothetical protein